jgi:hypothetical protein
MSMVMHVNSESGQSSPPRDSRRSAVVAGLVVVVGAALVVVAGGGTVVVVDAVSVHAVRAMSRNATPAVFTAAMYFDDREVGGRPGWPR